MKNVVILGSTGSIGRSALDVIEGLADQFRVVGLAARSNWRRLAEQARRYQPRWVAIADDEAGQALRAHLRGVEVWSGAQGLVEMAARPEVDIVVAAIVGAAALPAALAAVQAGKTLALANKETLVMAGELVMAQAARSGARIVPVDSEHSAVFQCLRAGRRQELRRVILTASGGPFRDRPAEDLRHVTLDDALAHPTWQMGPKVTIDSATLVNKALEIVEARWLFDLRPEQIEVLIHPESIVHSLVEFEDGSVIAQLSPPDMRLPIQYALTGPDRLPGRTPRLRLADLGRLTFQEPDARRFPALGLGMEVARRGGTSGAVFNAANETAVALFIDSRIRFDQIVGLCAQVLADHLPTNGPASLEAVQQADRWARHEVYRCLNTSSPAPPT